LRNNLYLLLLIPAVVSCIITAQTQKEYEAWKKRDKESISKFIHKDNEKFADYLKKDWKAYQIFITTDVDTVPKPISVPVKEIKDNIRNDLSNTRKIKKSIVIPVEYNNTSDYKIVNYSDKQHIVKLDFYGQFYPLPNYEAFHLEARKKINNQYIRQAWIQFSSSKYDELTKTLKNIAQTLLLNDWGYVVLLDDYCNLIYGNNFNNKYLFMWYILLHSGYDAKVGYGDNGIKLMLSINNNVYGVRYLLLNGDNKYFIYPFNNYECNEYSIYTYDENFGENLKKINLALDRAPILTLEKFEKKLQFRYRKEPMTVNVITNLNLIHFLNRMPQADLQIYFGYEPENEMRKSIISSLQKIIVNKTEGEAANILLRFVQKSQKYATDEQQFHTENYLFPEETIYYNYSDCEDRAIFYSYLVRELLGLDVVGLDYPGHVATGVRFTTDIAGDAIKYKNERFLICDPTYINADIGECMPKYKRVTPKIIVY